MSICTVGLYTRTSILIDKYDRYEKTLLFYCKQQGWGDVRYYRDRIGGMIKKIDFDRFESDLRKGVVDDELIGRLMSQQTEDEKHNRDAFYRLLADAANGTIDAMIVHDVGQLGRNRIEVFRAVDDMFQRGKKLYIYRIGEVTDSTCLFDSSPIDSPDSFGTSRTII